MPCLAPSLNPSAPQRVFPPLSCQAELAPSLEVGEVPKPPLSASAQAELLNGPLWPVCHCAWNHAPLVFNCVDLKITRHALKYFISEHELHPSCRLCHQSSAAAASRQPRPGWGFSLLPAQTLATWTWQRCNPRGPGRWNSELRQGDPGLGLLLF